MSERIEIKDDGYSVVIKPKGKGQVRLFVNDTDSTTQKTIAAIRQQQAEIEKLRAIMESQIETIDRIDRQRILAFDESEELRAELAAIKQEVSQAGYLGGPSLSACVNAMAGHLKDLQSELAAIKAAPVVGYLLEWNGPDDVAQYEVTSENPTDVVLYESIRELIARPTK